VRRNQQEKEEQVVHQEKKIKWSYPGTQEATKRQEVKIQGRKDR